MPEYLSCSKTKNKRLKIKLKIYTKGNYIEN